MTTERGTKRLLREPLVYFMVAGMLMFLASGFMGENGSGRIVVTADDRSRLTDQWEAAMGRSPTPQELQALMEQWVRQEIYYREALAMRLYENDPLIRRRLVQKFRFLEEGHAAEQAPDEAALRRYYQRHEQRYSAPERYTFSHRYFADSRQDPQADARRALESSITGDPGAGDKFPMMQGLRVNEWSQRDVAQLFGSDFADALPGLEVGRWSGPLASGYGWHLVKVEQRHPAQRLPFEEVARQVTADWLDEQREEATEAGYQSLRKQYEVILPP